MKIWELGKKIDFMWMPGGRHTITASYGRGDESVPIELTVQCDEDGARRVANSFAEIRAANPRRPPFICVEHQARERAAEPVAFKWGAIKHDGGEDVGIICTCEPSALGVSSVNGKIFTSFSPTFDTDADYSKLQCSECHKGRGACGCGSGRVFAFASGARGSRENPARVTRIDNQSCGSITNWNAFTSILPVAARQPDGTAVRATWSDAARKAALESRKRHGIEGAKFENTPKYFDKWAKHHEGMAEHHKEELRLGPTDRKEEEGHKESLEMHDKASMHYRKAADKLKSGDKDGANFHLGRAERYSIDACSSEPTNPLLAPLISATLTGNSVADELAEQVQAESELPSANGDGIDVLVARAAECDELVGEIEVLPKTRAQELAEAMDAVLAGGVVRAAWSDAAREAAAESRRSHASPADLEGSRDYAHRLSVRAEVDNTPAAHFAAMQAHKTAAEAHAAEGFHAKADDHVKRAKYHSEKAGFKSKDTGGGSKTYNSDYFNEHTGKKESRRVTIPA